MNPHLGLGKGLEVDGHRIERVLDTDVLGTLYLATDQGVDRTVALKVINPVLAQDPIFVQQFQLETSRLAQLNHPNILLVYDIRHTNQDTYLSTEYVEGTTLDAYLQRIPPTSRWRTAVALLRQVMLGLEHAHRAGITHESLRPERILVTSEGRVKLMDFGLTRMLTKVSLLPLSYNDADIRGYPSPEQLDTRQRADERSDVYSVGLILYEILTGTLPFDRSAPDFVVRTTLNDAVIQHPARLAPDAPRTLADIAMKALRRNPEDRYASIRDMLADLDASQRAPRPAARRARARRRWRYQELPRVVTPLRLAYGVLLLLALWGVVYVVRPPQASPFQVLSIQPGMAMAASARQPAGTAPPAARTPSPPPDTGSAPPDQTFTVAPDPMPAAAAPPDTPVAADPAPAVASAEQPDPPSVPAPRASAAHAAPSRPARPVLGSLTVRSSPPGAVVLIDGRVSGTTPNRNTLVAAGTTRVALTLDGFVAHVAEVAVPAGGNTVVDHTFSPLDAPIRLFVTPRGDIYVDGTLIIPKAEGLHTIFATPDSHLVSVRHLAFGAWERRIRPTMGRDTLYVVDFMATAPVDIMSYDRQGAFVMAEIVIDGIATGQFTPMTVEVPIGTRQIEVRAEGYIVAEPAVRNIEAGRQELIEFTLEDIVPEAIQ